MSRRGPTVCLGGDICATLTTSRGSKTVSVGIRATCSATIGEDWLPSLLGVMDAPLAAGFLKAFTVRRADILGRCDGLV